MCHKVRVSDSSVIMVIDLQKVLSQDLICLCSKSTTVLPQWTVPKTMNMSLLYFYCIRNKKIYCIEMYVYCIEKYIYCIYNTQQVFVSTSGIIIPYIEWGCQSPNPQEISGLNGNFVSIYTTFFRNLTLAWNGTCLLLHYQNAILTRKLIPHWLHEIV
jgi:hypothetical protein